jgi:hypothetical protein
VLQLVWYLQAASDNCTATYRELLDAWAVALSLNIKMGFW